MSNTEEVQALAPSLFVVPLLKTLYHLCGGVAGRKVKAESVYEPTAKLVGIDDITKYGEDRATGRPLVQVKIQYAYKTLKQKGLCEDQEDTRGKWSLTQAGVDKAKSLIGPTEVQKEDDVNQAQQTEDTKTDGFSLTISPYPPGDAYHLDSYIVEVAAAATPCYGHFSGSANTCLSCPISRQCRNKRAIEFTKLVRELDRARVGDKVSDKLKSNAEEGKLTKKVLNRQVNNLGQRPVPQQGGGNVQFPCKVCKKNIERGQLMWWVRNPHPDEGAYHADCVDVVD